MKGKIIFRKIRGKIIPIMQKEGTALDGAVAATALSFGADKAAKESGLKGIPRIVGSVTLGTVAGYALARKFHRVNTGFHALKKLLKGSL
jgi:ABC-type glycerol-3-phosphate transport system permease component